MERVGRVIGDELRRFGPAAGMTEIVSAWPDAVGEAIARNAWPARLARDGTLNVHTDSSAWAFELAHLAPTILERLRAALGQLAPSALRFAVGPLPQDALDDDSARRLRPPQPGPAERARAEALAKPIENEELRNLVARAAAASLAKEPADR